MLQLKIIDYIKTTVGQIPQVSFKWSWQDYLGALAVRSNIGRMNYAIEPGLYAINNPNETSPVFASANYKLSFDHLRKGLNGIAAWIVVLDTKGINVWCAAGKGTFGTEELIKQIKDTQIQKIINHNRIIVPQLGAPGVAAHDIKKQTGMSIVYGPVRANDIHVFLNKNMKVDNTMRKVTFTMWERTVLVPVELSAVLKHAIWIAIIGCALLGIHFKGYDLSLLMDRAPLFISVLIITITSGAILSPILLPYLPGKAFAVKGLTMGIISCMILISVLNSIGQLILWSTIAYSLLIISGSSFLAMGFTGASTYTSLSGVLYEMKRAVPLQKIGIGLACLSWIVSLLSEGV